MLRVSLFTLLFAAAYAGVSRDFTTGIIKLDFITTIMQLKVEAQNYIDEKLGPFSSQQYSTEGSEAFCQAMRQAYTDIEANNETAQQYIDSSTLTDKTECEEEYNAGLHKIVMGAATSLAACGSEAETAMVNGMKPVNTSMDDLDNLVNQLTNDWFNCAGDAACQANVESQQLDVATQQAEVKSAVDAAVGPLSEVATAYQKCLENAAGTEVKPQLDSALSGYGVCLEVLPTPTEPLPTTATA